MEMGVAHVGGGAKAITIARARQHDGSCIETEDLESAKHQIQTHGIRHPGERSHRASAEKTIRDRRLQIIKKRLSINLLRPPENKGSTKENVETKNSLFNGSAE